MSDVWSKMYIGLHVKYPLFLSDFNETWIMATNFRKILSRSSRSRVSPCGQTDMTKLLEILQMCPTLNHNIKITLLPTVLYGCESGISYQGINWEVLENLNSWYLHNVQSLLITFTVSKTMMMEWVMHVARIEVIILNISRKAWMQNSTSGTWS